MQVLSFINTGGPESWKNRDSKRVVRSHAMKYFRRKQRERKKSKIAENDSQPGESSFTTVHPLPEQENAQLEEKASTMRSSEAPSTTPSVDNLFVGKSSSITTVSQSLYDVPDRPTSTASAFSALPQIYPLQDAFSFGATNPTRFVSSHSSTFYPFASGRIHLSPTNDFDLSICMIVYGALDAAGANFDRFTKHYFRSVHSYLTIINRNRFFKRVFSLSKKANAETAILLLCVRLCSEPTQSGITASGGDLYRTASRLYKAAYEIKGASIELLQAGSLLTLFEHNAALRGFEYERLKHCSSMARTLGLDASARSPYTVVDEERRRAYWGLLSLDCIVSLHDEKHERALVFEMPSLDDVLPSISDAGYEDSVDELCASNTCFTVQSRLPVCADSFSRQGQSVRLMYLVQKILREKFDLSPDLMVSRIGYLDKLLVSTLRDLLADCNGKATQYCGPISCCISASFLLHEYQLLSTMHVPPEKLNDPQALTRSKMAIETMIEMVVNILREFPVAHTPELSPTALFCPYQAAMLGQLLDRISGLNPQPTLLGTTFDFMINGLKHFSTIWPCTTQYITLIQQAQ
ncbi:uncharacterized protein PV09_09325 [Verruconis gallopava]|uniref:Xylanolytic transcriptional activator regulatory domain-containing protein n=1 Tax=Verruconis gallopava TaxID=253628 RepID=A0A0D1ZXY2_9PEZI|nr:uncharacterized protein PV09_09325 [Verruconis gallopava]KIV98939.1 hypothetical protein PV09_09325 [Verruconis gallopava]